MTTCLKSEIRNVKSGPSFLRRLHAGIMGIFDMRTTSPELQARESDIPPILRGMSCTTEPPKPAPLPVCATCDHEGSCITCTRFQIAMNDINDGGPDDPAQYSSSHQA